MKTIAVIPAYNEASTIQEVVEKAQEYVDQVVVVDDGSIDSTYENAKEADILIRNPVNMSKGHAMITGIETAVREGADVIIAIDADGQHDPEDIPRFLETLEKENLDIVFGSRNLDQNMPPVMRFGNWFLTNTTRMLYGIHVKDTQSGYRAFTATAYKKIKWQSKDYRMETEMIVNAAKAGLKYKELIIKTTYHNAHKGTTVIDGLKIFTSLVIWRVKK